MSIKRLLETVLIIEEGSFEDLLHQLTEGVHDPGIFKAIFMAGGGGSGKGSVLRKSGGVDRWNLFGDKATNKSAESKFTSSGLRVVNSDAMFEMLMKKESLAVLVGKGLNFDDYTKEELADKDAIRAAAKKLTDKSYRLLLDGKLGMILDGTAKSFGKVASQKAELESEGYDCYMLFVDTDLPTTLKRNASRERSVEEDIIIDIWTQVNANKNKYRGLFGNKFHIVDNNNGATDAAGFANLFKKLSQAVKAPVKNPVAKAWIKNALTGKKAGLK